MITGATLVLAGIFLAANKGYVALCSVGNIFLDAIRVGTHEGVAGIVAAAAYYTNLDFHTLLQ